MMNSDFFKGIVAGTAVGAVMGMIFDPTRSSRDTNILKKKAGKFIKATGKIMENLADI